MKKKRTAALGSPVQMRPHPGPFRSAQRIEFLHDKLSSEQLESSVEDEFIVQNMQVK